MNELLLVLAEYYSYLKKPFLDLREVSLEKRRQATQTMDNPDFGERIKEELRNLIEKWKQEENNSEENLRELQLEFFVQTKKVLSGR